MIHSPCPGWGSGRFVLTRLAEVGYQPFMRKRFWSSLAFGVAVASAARADVVCPVDEFLNVARALRADGFTLRLETPPLGPGSNGQYTRENNTVWINPSHDFSHMYVTLLHEVSHVLHQSSAIDLFINDRAGGPYYPVGFTVDELAAWRINGAVPTLPTNSAYLMAPALSENLFRRADTQLTTFAGQLTPQAIAEIRATGVYYGQDGILELIINGNQFDLAYQPYEIGRATTLAFVGPYTREGAIDRFAAIVPAALVELQKYSPSVPVVEMPVTFGCDDKLAWQEAWEDFLSEEFWQTVRPPATEATEEAQEEAFWRGWLVPSETSQDSVWQEVRSDWFVMSSADVGATPKAAEIELFANSGWWPSGVDCDIYYCGPSLTWQNVFAMVSEQPIFPSDLSWDALLWGNNGPFLPSLPLAPLTAEELDFIWTEQNEATDPVGPIDGP